MVETAHLSCPLSETTRGHLGEPQHSGSHLMWGNHDPSENTFDEHFAAKLLTRLQKDSTWLTGAAESEVCHNSNSSHSQSPSSSDSTESYSSLIFQSPFCSDQLCSTLSLSLDTNTLESSEESNLCRDNHHVVNQITDSSINEYSQLTDSSLLANVSPSTYEDLFIRMANSHRNQQLPIHPNEDLFNISHTKDTTESSEQRHDQSTKSYSSETADETDNTSEQNSRRPETLNFGKCVRSSRSTDQSKLFANSVGALRLEEQLASADNAWFGALDLPSLYLEDIDLLLSTTSCLQSPNELVPQISSPCSVSGVLTTDFPSTASMLTPNSPNWGQSDVNLCPSEKRFMNLITDNTCLKEDLIETSTILSKSPSKEGTDDSEDTVTCSEAEYQTRQLKLKEQRKRHRARRRFTRQFVWTTHVESEDSDFDEPQIQHQSKSVARRRTVFPTRRERGSVTCARLLSRRRMQSVQADAQLKAWWPKTCCVFDPDDSEQDNREPIAEDFSQCIPQEPHVSVHHSTDDSGHESTHCLNKVHNSNRTSNRKPSRRSLRRENKPQRQRRQMELWQFVLCRLETSRRSAFQWVNRSTGVFCIVDTHAAAKEWGRYRNNSRMDYEKMARAMRFYYKDSILRKAHQQLHFQFAMPCVNWAEKTYRKC